MKKILFAVIMFTASFAYSQTPMSAEEKTDQVVAKLTNEVQLTEAQIPKVKEITLERMNKVTAAHQKSGSDRNRLQAANKLIYDDWENKLKGILTEEQFNKYLASHGK